MEIEYFEFGTRFVSGGKTLGWVLSTLNGKYLIENKMDDSFISIRYDSKEEAIRTFMEVVDGYSNCCQKCS